LWSLAGTPALWLGPAVLVAGSPAGERGKREGKREQREREKRETNLCRGFREEGFGIKGCVVKELLLSVVPFHQPPKGLQRERERERKKERERERKKEREREREKRED